MWTITARLNVFGYELREFDLTPVLGLALVAFVIVLLAGNVG